MPVCALTVLATDQESGRIIILGRIESTISNTACLLKDSEKDYQEVETNELIVEGLLLDSSFVFLNSSIGFNQKSAKSSYSTDSLSENWSLMRRFNTLLG